MQRIFKCDKTQDIRLTSDYVRNILIYGLPFSIYLYSNYKF